MDAGATSGRRRTTAGRLIRRTLWFLFLISPIAVAVVLALNQSWGGDTARDAARETGSPSPGGENAQGPGAATNAGWKLAWRDEFNGSRCPSQARWGFEHGFVRNGELQWYQPENAFCRHGALIIEARRASKPNPNYRASSPNWRLSRRSAAYTSASLMSRHRFTYGRVEVRARLDPRRGSWPALWTLGTAYRREPTSWPATGEIDIMEYYRRTLLANVCKPKRTRCAWSSARLPLSKLGGRGWAKRFHTWAMDWSSQRIDLFLDGKLLNHVAVADAVGEGHRNPYVNKPAFLLLSQALGGANGGDPTSTKFPVRLEVDYVRIYMRAATRHSDSPRP